MFGYAAAMFSSFVPGEYIFRILFYFLIKSSHFPTPVFVIVTLIKIFFEIHTVNTHGSVQLKMDGWWESVGFLYSPPLCSSLTGFWVSDAYTQHTLFHYYLQMSALVMHFRSTRGRCVGSYSYSVHFSCELTITRNERPVESAVRVQLAAFGRSFAGRSLHEELVFVEGALLSAIQWLALRLERTPGLLSVRLPLTRNESGAVFGFSGRESPERVRLVIPTLPSSRAIIWIHRCHIAVWDARCVHT